VVVLGVFLCAILVVPVTGMMGTVRPAIDLPWNNINAGWNTHVNSKEACAELCDANPNCLAATYVPGIQGPEGHCWLKKPVPAEVENFNCYSYYKIPTIPIVTVSLVCIAPTAEFSAVMPSGPAPVAVQFTDQSTGAVSWTWDFGDTGTSTQQHPSHTYMQPGTYTVTLIITGVCPGSSDTMTKTSYISVAGNLEVMGSLYVSSIPSGGRVYVDGIDQGTTPITVKHLSSGSHIVRLTLSGYNDYTTSVTIINGQTTQLPVTLTTTSSPTGSLQVTTTPAGAAVYVDGGSQGITPKTLSGLAPGSHTVKLTKAGYVDYTATVVVVAGTVSPIMVQLVPLQQTTATGGGTLNIISIPENAIIGLDGIAQGTTPKSIQNVKAGSHTITLSYPGYNEWTGTVTVVAGGTMPITITLVAQKAMTLPGSPGTTILPSGTGSLIIQSTPTGANVYLDGEGRGMTPLTLRNVTPGTHRLLLTSSGFSDYQETIQLSAGSQHTVTAQMVAGQASPGFEAMIALTAFFAVLILWRSRR
jgi:PKD repeat protein